MLIHSEAVAAVIALARLFAKMCPETLGDDLEATQRLLTQAWWQVTVDSWKEVFERTDEGRKERADALALLAQEYDIKCADIVCRSGFHHVQVAKVGDKWIDTIDLPGAMPLWVHYVQRVRELRAKAFGGQGNDEQADKPC